MDPTCGESGKFHESLDSGTCLRYGLCIRTSELFSLSTMARPVSGWLNYQDNIKRQKRRRQETTNVSRRWLSQLSGNGSN
jgi:hypothetical protein